MVPTQPNTERCYSIALESLLFFKQSFQYFLLIFLIYVILLQHHILQLGHF